MSTDELHIDTVTHSQNRQYIRILEYYETLAIYHLARKTGTPLWVINITEAIK